MELKRLKFPGGALLILFLSLAPVAAAYAQDQGVVTTTINPLASSGVSGTATLRTTQGGTALSLDLTGLAPNSSHAAHIHTGSCANPGGIAIGLPALTADASGRATATDSVNASLSSLTDGNHIIMVHADAPPDFGAGIACGDIPVEGAASTPPATPMGAAPGTPMATAAPMWATAVPTPVATQAAAPATASSMTNDLAPLGVAALLALVGIGLGGGLLLRRR